jgi:hypothetical protein
MSEQIMVNKDKLIRLIDDNDGCVPCCKEKYDKNNCLNTNCNECVIDWLQKE